MRLKDIPPGGVLLEDFLDDKGKKRKPAKPKALPTNHRAALLDRMKAECPEDPETRAEFRIDVQTILERWDGASPLLWFVWVGGTHLMLLGPPDAKRPKVWADQRELEAAIDMARGGQIFFADTRKDEEGYGFAKLRSVEARFGLREYYLEKEPLASTHAVDVYA